MPLGNSIGSYLVRNWFGAPPERLQERAELLDYAGADYQAVRLLGLRSTVFTMESIVDLVSSTACRTELGNYKAMIGGGPYPLIWNANNLDTEGLRVLVLDVVPIEIKRRALICGGLYSGTVDLHVKWSLLLTPYTP